MTSVNQRMTWSMMNVKNVNWQPLLFWLYLHTGAEMIMANNLVEGVSDIDSSLVFYYSNAHVYKS